MSKNFNISCYHIEETTTNNNMENKDRKERKSQSYSLIDRFVEKLPEIHIKGYNYCGPNTDLKNRLARSESGVNDLDYACKVHDIAYAQSKDLKTRNNADKILFMKAFSRVFAKDSRIGERFSAIIVSTLIGNKIILNKIELYVRNIFRNFSATKSNKE